MSTRTNASTESCEAGYGFFLRRGPQFCSQLIVNDWLKAAGLDEIGEHTYKCMCEQYEYGVQLWVPINQWEYIVRPRLDRERKAVS